LEELGKAAAAKGASLLALNPFHAMFPSNRERASPYQPSDRRFLDPAMIALDGVPELADPGRFTLPEGRLIDWPAGGRLKRSALAQAFMALSGHPARKAAFESFKTRGGPTLSHFALFQALEEKAGSTAIGAFDDSVDHGSEIGAAAEFACYLQFLAEEQ